MKNGLEYVDNAFELQKEIMTQKTVEMIIDLIFWFGIISLGLAIVLEILHRIETIDIETFFTINIIVNVISTAIMYYAARLAHKGKLAAGIIDIIVSILFIISYNLQSYLVISMWTLNISIYNNILVFTFFDNFK